jgi:hypothetical protein
MIYHFTLPEFPESDFKMEHSMWSGKIKLYKDGEPVAQSAEKGKPFLIKAIDGTTVLAYPKTALPDFVPNFEINGVKHPTASKLLWYEYAIGALPIVLVFLGGMLGGAIGAAGTVYNYNTFREDSPAGVKYLKVAGTILVCYALFYALAYFLLRATH